MIEVIDRLLDIWKDGRKIAFLGVGSPLRADDSVGLFIVEGLKERLQMVPGRELQFYLGESAPENFSGAIREFRPEYLIIFDAAEMEQTPGTFSLIEQDQIGGAGFSTHMLPLKLLSEYLIMVTGCRVLVVGIQPKLLEFGYEITKEVRTAAEEFVKEVGGRLLSFSK
jgi:hydrogenase 3 maturation protease